MCLNSKEQEPCIADRDITCYKIVSVRGGKYYAPCVGRRIQKRYIIGRDLYCAHGESEVKDLCEKLHRFDYYMVRKGFIHTYGTVDVAFSKMGFNKEVYECVIPKGCEYYKDFACPELASKAIRFVRKIVPQYEKIKF